MWWFREFSDRRGGAQENRGLVGVGKKRLAVEMGAPLNRLGGESQSPGNLWNSLQDKPEHLLLNWGKRIPPKWAASLHHQNLQTASGGQLLPNRFLGESPDDHRGGGSGACDKEPAKRTLKAIPLTEKCHEGGLT